MPRVKYADLFNLLRNSSFFTFRSLAQLTGEKYASFLISKWKRERRIIRLAKGVYSFQKSPFLLAKVLPLAYVGLGSAAFLHGAWNQATRITILTPLAARYIRHGEREIGGFKVVVRKITSKLYFGYTLFYLEDVNEWIRISDIEKTIIDLIYFSYPFASEILPGLFEKANKARLRSYLKLMGRRKVKGWKRVASLIEENF